MVFILNRFTITKKQIPYLVNRLHLQNIRPILDYTNERKDNHYENYSEIMNLIRSYPRQHIAVKLSSLQSSKIEDYLQKITENAIQHRSKILMDAEQDSLYPMINKMTDKLMMEYNKNDVHIYKTYQMYRRDSFPLLKQDLLQSRNYHLGIKLVRGAYYNEDKKYNVLFKTIQETHNNYNHGLEFFSKNFQGKDLLMCASHNEKSIEIAKTIIPQQQLQFAHLLGMSDKCSSKLAKENYQVFKYVPYGNFKDTIPYLLRRLYENYPMITNLWK